MEVAPQLQYGALGLLAIVIGVVLKFAFERINKSSEFVQNLSIKSIDSLEGTSKEFSTSQIAVSGALQKLGEEVTKTQGGMLDSLEAMNQARIEADRERKEEHVQLLADHQVILERLIRIEGKLNAGQSHNT
jgi:hypothetical protein